VLFACELRVGADCVSFACSSISAFSVCFGLQTLLLVAGYAHAPVLARKLVAALKLSVDLLQPLVQAAAVAPIEAPLWGGLRSLLVVLRAAAAAKLAQISAFAQRVAEVAASAEASGSGPSPSAAAQGPMLTTPQAEAQLVVKALKDSLRRALRSADEWPVFEGVIMDTFSQLVPKSKLSTSKARGGSGAIAAAAAAASGQLAPAGTDSASAAAHEGALRAAAEQACATLAVYPHPELLDKVREPLLCSLDLLTLSIDVNAYWIRVCRLLHCMAHPRHATVSYASAAQVRRTCSELQVLICAHRLAVRCVLGVCRIR
jgi:hypothetical protein